MVLLQKIYIYVYIYIYICICTYISMYMCIYNKYHHIQNIKNHNAIVDYDLGVTSNPLTVFAGEAVTALTSIDLHSSSGTMIS